MAWFSFGDLCDQPLSVRDYMELFAQIDTIFIEGIARMSRRQHDQARRFIHVVDAMYERRVRLYCTAAAAPDALFDSGAGAGHARSGLAQEPDADTQHAQMLRDDLQLPDAVHAALPIFTGEEEHFAFDRAVSRLIEMQSAQYG